MTCSQILNRLNLKYLLFVSLQGAFRHAGTDVKGSIDVLSRSRTTSCQKEVDENNIGKPPCEECGITKEGILRLLDLLPPHLPHDLLFLEKSMNALQLKGYFCAIHNYIVNPFNILTTTNFSTLKEKLVKENKNQACNKCGIH